jgi:cold shock protein
VRAPHLANFDWGGLVVMPTGKVKWFNNAKGYGFILPECGGEDLFVHYSSIQMEGYKTLKAGQPVLFDVQQGPKGSHAVNIRAHAEPLIEGIGTGSAAAVDGVQSLPDAMHASDDWEASAAVPKRAYEPSR